MNVEKIFNALENDEMNSALSIIIAELESQGYRVKVNDILLSVKNIIEGKYKGLEDHKDALEISLYLENKFDQKFKLNFIDYHRISITKC